jgi:flagellar FliJ protein
MKAKSERLALVADLAANDELKAQEQMQIARRFLDQQNSQLNALQDYRDQYIAQYKTQQAGARHVQQLLNYQKFIAQLDGAIEQQGNMVKQAELAFQQTKGKWLALTEKRKGMKNLENHYAEKERLDREKKEEKQIMDDFTASRARRHSHH